MYLAFNNLQWLICDKTEPNQTKLTQDATQGQIVDLLLVRELSESYISQ